MRGLPIAALLLLLSAPALAEEPAPPPLEPLPPHQDQLAAEPLPPQQDQLPKDGLAAPQQDQLPTAPRVEPLAQEHPFAPAPPAAPAVTERVYAGLSGAGAMLPVAEQLALVGGLAFEGGLRVTEGTAFGVQLFGLFAPGWKTFAGVAEARYFYDIGEPNAEPYLAVGLGWGEIRTPDLNAGIFLFKLGVGGKRYLLKKHLYLGAEVSLFDFVMLAATLTVGVSF